MGAAAAGRGDVGEVGDRFDGRPARRRPARAVRARPRPRWPPSRRRRLDRTVHLSFGDTPRAEYALQLAADHLVHAWDLARALGVDDTLDPEAVGRRAGVVRADGGRLPGAGVIGPRVAGAGRRRPADRGCWRCSGRARREHALAAVERFTAAFDAKDVDAVMAAMTPGLRLRGHQPARRAAARRAPTRCARRGRRCSRAPRTRAFTTEEVDRRGRPRGGPLALRLGTAGTCAASTSSPSATGWSPRSWPTSRADRLDGPAGQALTGACWVRQAWA